MGPAGLREQARRWRELVAKYLRDDERAGRALTEAADALDARAGELERTRDGSRPPE